MEHRYMSNLITDSRLSCCNILLLTTSYGEMCAYHPKTQKKSRNYEIKFIKILKGGK